MLGEADDRGAAVRIACGRDDSGRLVQQDVREPLRHEQPAVEIDDVTLLDEGVQLAAHAVHAHAPVLISSSAPLRDATPVRAR